MKLRASVDPEALLCALILSPQSFSRNRFFELFEDPEMRRVRRRAARVRGIVRQLAGEGKYRAELLGEQVLGDGRVLIRYRVSGLNLQRTSALSELEAAVVRYALHRARGSELSSHDRKRVERALRALGQKLGLPAFA